MRIPSPMDIIGMFIPGFPAHRQMDWTTGMSVHMGIKIAIPPFPVTGALPYFMSLELKELAKSVIINGRKASKEGSKTTHVLLPQVATMLALHQAVIVSDFIGESKFFMGADTVFYEDKMAARTTSMALEDWLVGGLKLPTSVALLIGSFDVLVGGPTGINFGMLIDGLLAPFKALVDAVSTVVDMAVSAVTAVAQAAVSVVSAVADAAVTAVGAVADAAGAVVGAVADAAGAVVSAVAPVLATGAGAVLGGLVGGPMGAVAGAALGAQLSGGAGALGGAGLGAMVGGLVGGPVGAAVGAGIGGMLGGSASPAELPGVGALVGGGLGTVAGAILGGPVGALAGAALGSAAGDAVGGLVSAGANAFGNFVSQAADGIGNVAQSIGGAVSGAVQAVGGAVGGAGLGAVAGGLMFGPVGAVAGAALGGAMGAGADNPVSAIGSVVGGGMGAVAGLALGGPLGMVAGAAAGAGLGGMAADAIGAGVTATADAATGAAQQSMARIGAALHAGAEVATTNPLQGPVNALSNMMANPPQPSASMSFNASIGPNGISVQASAEASFRPSRPSSGGGGAPPSGGTTQSGGGGAPPSGGTTQSGGGGAPPSGGTTQSGGGGAPPSGGTTQSGGGGAPPSGGTTQSGGGGAPPSGATSQSAGGGVPPSGGDSGSSRGDAPPPDPETRTGTIPLTQEEKLRLISFTAYYESRNNFGACNRDIEFYRLTNHRCYQRHHCGLSWGFIQFMQDCGSLGKVLRRCHQKSASKFQETFGPHWEELLRVTTASGPSSQRLGQQRGPRTQPVGGADLWEESWVQRFQAAGRVPEFQLAQKEIAIEDYMNRAISRICVPWQLMTQRGICFANALCVGWGNGGAVRKVRRVLGDPPGQGTPQQKLQRLVDGLPGRSGRRFRHWLTDDRLSDDLTYTPT